MSKKQVLPVLGGLLAAGTIAGCNNSSSNPEPLAPEAPHNIIVYDNFANKDTSFLDKMIDANSSTQKGDKTAEEIINDYQGTDGYYAASRRKYVKLFYKQIDELKGNTLNPEEKQAAIDDLVVYAIGNREPSLLAAVQAVNPK